MYTYLAEDPANASFWMALRMNIEEKNLYDFLIFTFFKPWETYEVVLQNSAVPKAAAIASEMVWGSRSTGGSPDFWGLKNGPLVAQRF